MGKKSLLKLNNQTDFPATLDCLYNLDGLDIFIITIKGTFTLADSLRLSDEQPAPARSDEYWGEEGLSSLRQGADVTLMKSGTDIIMTGNACAPKGKKVRELDVHLSVGPVSKTLKVIGERVWEPVLYALLPSKPELFDTMPLVYERAYGGVHEREEKTLSEPRNPSGRGFIGKRKKKELTGQPLPNIEDPDNLIRFTHDTPAPAGFGWIAPNWEPRKSLAGTGDQHWKKTRAPYPPEDCDRQFLQTAHPDLISTEPLKGGEAVHITNMSPDGDIRFDLPAVTFDVNAEFNDGSEVLDMSLATVHLQPNERQVSLVWQGAVNGNKRRLGCQSVTISNAIIKYPNT
ncbi:MAG: DUF2169 domain-containing protein [Reinekea sp.]